MHACLLSLMFAYEGVFVMEGAIAGAKIVMLQKPRFKKPENIPLTIHLTAGLTNVIQDCKLCILGYE